MSIKQELDEMMAFDQCKIARVMQHDCEVHICSYKVGDESWITIFEDYDGEDSFTRVNVNRCGLVELYKIIKECLDK